MPPSSDRFPLLVTEIPGPASREWCARLKKVEAPTITHISKDWPIFWERASGYHVWDVDGNRYVDLTSAFGVASLGHAHPDVMEAVRKQTHQLPHAMGDVHPSPLKAALCERLSALTYERWSGGRVRGMTILCNSGFEAVEVALKTAMLQTQKRGVIAFEGGYHGLGYGALDTTWRSDFRQPFSRQLGGFTRFVPFPRMSGDLSAEKKEMEKTFQCMRDWVEQEEVGAVLVEPFQGRGGEVIPPEGFLRRLREFCTETGCLLILDEIYTGFGRTGQWFACEHEQVIPDLICLGKALSGNLPLSACVGAENVMRSWPESRGEAIHTSTFLGNPLACAAALGSLNVLERDWKIWEVAEKGEAWVRSLKNRFNGHPDIKEIRGRGLMVGVEFRSDGRINPTQLAETFLKRGILVLPGGSKGEVLTLAPPFSIPREVLDWVTEELALALNPK